MQTAFQIESKDNVATALTELKIGAVHLRGDAKEPTIEAMEDISVGHKIALRDIKEGEEIFKYATVIGKATRDIPKGTWVHLHCMRSCYDERSSHLDIHTGAPTDIVYS